VTSPSPRLRDHVVLVTGASSGVGEATARAMVRDGAAVVLGARRLERLEQLCGELGDDVAVCRRADVTSADDVESLVALALERFGRLDAVFANAGVGPGGTLDAPVIDDWQQILLTNVLGLAHTIRFAARAIESSGGLGDVIVNSSIVGRRVTPGNPIYTASKFAASALSEAARLELGQRIRVTVLETGAVATEFPRRDGEPRLAAEDVANVVVDCLTRPRHITVEEVVMTAVPPPTGGTAHDQHH
jgi:NADP-dependent 3-hydroxy acid dehydrogenase YdfG